MMGDGTTESAGRGGVLRRLPARGLVVAAVALFACAGGVLAACPHVGARVISGGVPDLLVGLAACAFAVAGCACLGERARRRGEPFPRAAGRALLAVSAVGFALLLAACAWLVWRLVAMGAPYVRPWQFLDYAGVPPFDFLAALLPVGACLAFGRRGRVAVYVLSGALALTGAVLYVRFGIAAHSASELLAVEDMTPVPIPADRAIFATVLSLAPRLVALGLGLAVALCADGSVHRGGEGA